MRLFGFKKTIKLGLKSLWMHKLRSTLTVLGIVFGVCSVISMLAIGEGASREAQEAIKRLGSTNIIIQTVEPLNENNNNSEENDVQHYGLTYQDAESIRNTIPSVEVVIPIREIASNARYDTRQCFVNLIGTIAWYTDIAPIKMMRGRFLSSLDINNHQNVCVVDRQVARSLFVFEDPIDKYVKMQGTYFKVIGVANEESVSVEGINSERSSGGSAGTSGNIYIPISTAKDRFSELKASFSGGSRKLAMIELQKITVKVSEIEDVIPIQSALSALLERLHKGKQDYRIVVPLELLREAKRRRRIFSIVLGSIAAISLIVGGIGIMNIMLATVSERTREIGIRRALGATKHDIVVQFLTETVILTLLGGLVGIGLGVSIPSIVSAFGKMPTVITGWSLLLSFGISGGVGIAFGIYPAYKAANMDPIESLRHE